MCLIATNGGKTRHGIIFAMFWQSFVPCHEGKDLANFFWAKEHTKHPDVGSFRSQFFPSFKEFGLELFAPFSFSTFPLNYLLFGFLGPNIGRSRISIKVLLSSTIPLFRNDSKYDQFCKQRR